MNIRVAVRPDDDDQDQHDDHGHDHDLINMMGRRWHTRRSKRTLYVWYGTQVTPTHGLDRAPLPCFTSPVAVTGSKNEIR